MPGQSTGPALVFDLRERWLPHDKRFYVKLFIRLGVGVCT